MIGGIIALAAGFAVFSGAASARLLGIIIATISIVVNFTFIPLAPWWALTIILIGLWAIHSLFMHRRFTRLNLIMSVLLSRCVWGCSQPRPASQREEVAKVVS